MLLRRAQRDGYSSYGTVLRYICNDETNFAMGDRFRARARELSLETGVS